MPQRTEELTGIVRPSLDDQALSRETRKLERAMGGAVENLVPGGRGLKKLARSLRSGGGGGGGASAGGGGGTNVQMAQLQELKEIREELEKIGVGQARGRGRGSGGGGGIDLPTPGGGTAIAAVAAMGIPGLMQKWAKENVDPIDTVGSTIHGPLDMRTAAIDDMLATGGMFNTVMQTWLDRFAQQQVNPDNVNIPSYTDPGRGRGRLDTGNYARDGQQFKNVNNVDVNVDMSGLANQVDFSDALLDRISDKFTRELEGKIGGGGSTGLRLTNK